MNSNDANILFDRHFKTAELLENIVWRLCVLSANCLAFASRFCWAGMTGHSWKGRQWEQHAVLIAH